MKSSTASERGLLIGGSERGIRQIESEREPRLELTMSEV